MDNNNFGISEGAQQAQIVEAMDANNNQNLHTLEGATVMAMREVLTELLSNAAVEEIEELGNQTDPEMPPLLPATDEDEDEDDDDLDTDVNDSDLFGSDTDGEELLETPSTIHVSEDTGFEEAKTPEISPRILFARGEEEESEEEEEEDPMCSVCYEILTIKNIVNTKCNHTFCKKCFYRWIEVNATCPQCRDPIDSHTTLTDEQITRECSEIYTNFRTNLKDWSRNMKRNKRLITENCRLQVQNIQIQQESQNYMNRIIRVRKDIERNTGYSLGCIAAKNEIIYGYPIHHKNYAVYNKDTEWYNGYELGFHRTLNDFITLEKKNAELDKKVFDEMNEKDYAEDVEKASENFKKVMSTEFKPRVSVKRSTTRK